VDHPARPASPALRRRRWLGALAQYLAARLAAACGDPPGLTALQRTIRQRGTVHCEGSEVIAAFSLERHPLALRLAGLDRDPGWVPLAGRTIRFEFT
jgi:hypothetical protein